jgi:hypothetical protein
MAKREKILNLKDLLFDFKLIYFKEFEFKFD